MGFFGVIRFFYYRLWRSPVPDDARLAALIAAG
jgi:hypothetical protein